MLGLVLANVFWGASSIAAKEALKQLNAVEIVTLRFAIALFILITAALLLKGKDVLKIDAKDIPMFVLLSLANVSVGFILQVQALNYTTVTNFSLEFNLSTFFIMLLGVVLLDERLTGKKMIGAIVAFAGAVIIISGGRMDLSSAHFIGDIMGVGSAISFGLFTVFSKKIARKYDILTILIYTFLFGVLELLPCYILGTPMTPLASLSALSWSSILFLAVLCSVFAFIIYTHGLNRLKASDVAMSIYVTPLAGIVLAVILLGETMSILTVGGAALILTGMYVAQERGQKAENRPGRNDGARHPYTPIRGE